MALSVVELIGNPRAGSRTRTLADATVAALRAGLPVALDEPTVVELAEVVSVSFGGPAPSPGSPSTVEDPLQGVREARLLVVATPTYKGVYTGLLKLFLDRYGHRELAGTVAVPVGIAAAPAHRDSVAAALTALLVELGSAVPAPALAVLESELAGTGPAALATGWVARHGEAIAAALAASEVPALS
jgi:FMN reductase